MIQRKKREYVSDYYRRLDTPKDRARKEVEIKKGIAAYKAAHPEPETADDLIAEMAAENGADNEEERITHNEKPWKEARKGYSDTIPSHEIISKTSIQEYYKEVNEKYKIDSEDGLIKYIRYMRQAIA